jgi:hypothetical protein
VTNDPHRDPFDDELILAQIELDGAEVRILGQQLHVLAALPEAFYGDLVGIDTRDHDLTVLRAGTTMHGDEILIQNTDALGLILRRGRHLPGHRQIGQKPLHLRGAQFTRMALMVKQDESLNPVGVCLLSWSDSRWLLGYTKKHQAVDKER